MPAWELGCYTNGIELKAEGGDGQDLGDLPVLFCHGMGDKVVTPEFGSRFYSKTREMGIDAQVCTRRSRLPPALQPAFTANHCLISCLISRALR